MKFDEANKLLNNSGYYIKSSEVDEDREYFYYYDSANRFIYLEVCIVGGKYKTPFDIPRVSLDNVLVAEFYNMPFSWLSKECGHIFDEEDYTETVTLMGDDIDLYFSKCIYLKNPSNWPSYYIKLKQAEISRYNFISAILPIVEEYEFALDVTSVLSSVRDKFEMESYDIMYNKRYNRYYDYYIRFDTDLMSLALTYTMAYDGIYDTHIVFDPNSKKEIEKFEELFMTNIICEDVGIIRPEYKYLFGDYSTDEQYKLDNSSSIENATLVDSGNGWIQWKL